MHSVDSTGIRESTADKSHTHEIILCFFLKTVSAF